jgi:hypothetical protein
VEGSLQISLGENMALEEGAAITGDLYAPGIPTVVQKGNPKFEGTIVGTGRTLPKDYWVALNGNSRLSHLYTRIDAPMLPLVTPPPVPRAKRTVILSSIENSAVAFPSIRNLKLEAPTGGLAVPPGTYGDFASTSEAGFILGIPGSPKPCTYNFQSLELGAAKLLVAGPVVINVAKGFACTQIVNPDKNPDWLVLNIAEGNFLVCSGGEVYGTINVPNGTVFLNDQSRLVGQIACDHLVIEGNGLLRIQAGAKPKLGFRQASLQMSGF